MYNRYIPQPDGTFRRDRIPSPKPEHPKPCPQPTIPCEPSTAPSPSPPPAPKQSACHPQKRKEPGGIGSFFKHLLPKDLDTADLLIIILLLLMAGDKEEDQTNALLTLALYFFM